MLNEDQLLNLLLERRTRIIDEHEKLEKYREELRGMYVNLLPKIGSGEIVSTLGTASGAIPVESFRRYIPLEHSFEDHSAMKQWAVEILSDRAIVAVDGSQIFSSADFNIPIGFVQAGAFWVSYGKKHSDFGQDILSDVLIGNSAIEKYEQSEPLHDMSISLVRLAKELELALKVVEKHQERGLSACLLLDGSLVLRFLRRADEEIKEAMCNEIVKLLRVCERKLIPVAGYVDYSLAKDITSTLEKLSGKDYDIKVSDVSIVGPFLEEGGFGARTPVFRLKHSLLDGYYEEFSDDIYFFYQKIHSGFPIRVEFPKWIYNANLVEDLAQVIAAQVVIGDGYPYVLLRAHETAILEGADRDRFFEVVTWFLSKKCGVSVWETRKAKQKRLSIL
jgi:hypothetical protein